MATPLTGGAGEAVSGGVLPLPAPAPPAAPDRTLAPAADGVVGNRSVALTGVALPRTGVDVDALVRLGLLLLAVGATVLLLLTGPAARQGQHPSD